MKKPEHPECPQYLPEKKIIKNQFSITDFVTSFLYDSPRENGTGTLMEFLIFFSHEVKKIFDEDPNMVTAQILKYGQYEDTDYIFENAYYLTEEEQKEAREKNHILRKEYEIKVDQYRKENDQYFNELFKIRKEQNKIREERRIKDKEEKKNKEKTKYDKVAMKQYVLNEKYFLEHPEEANKSNPRYCYFLKLKESWDKL